MSSRAVHHSCPLVGWTNCLVYPSVPCLSNCAVVGTELISDRREESVERIWYEAHLLIYLLRKDFSFPWEAHSARHHSDRQFLKTGFLFWLKTEIKNLGAQTSYKRACMHTHKHTWGCERCLAAVKAFEKTRKSFWGGVKKNNACWPEHLLHRVM